MRLHAPASSPASATPPPETATSQTAKVRPTTRANQPCGENAPLPSFTASGPIEVDQSHRDPDPGRPWRERPVPQRGYGDDPDPCDEGEPRGVVGQPAGVPQRPGDGGIRVRTVGDGHEQRGAGTEDPGAAGDARHRSGSKPTALALGAPDDLTQARGEDDEHGKSRSEEEVAREQLGAVVGRPPHDLCAR